jgi:methanogenic corrinoid protein MtbC1
VILKRIAEIVQPKPTDATKAERVGKCIIGTVAGDIHDIGKDIVVFMLDVSGFEVYDLGIDVPVQRFVEKIRETNTRIIGLSGFFMEAVSLAKGW